MQKFEVGQKYRMEWPYMEDNRRWFTDWEVISRTEKTITISNGRETKKARVHIDQLGNDVFETAYPFGKKGYNNMFIYAMYKAD